MKDSKGEKEAHTGILVVEKNGTAYMRDNSSKNNHVLNKDIIYYCDPAIGYVDQQMSEFINNWSGISFLVSKK